MDAADTPAAGALAVVSRPWRDNRWIGAARSRGRCSGVAASSRRMVSGQAADQPPASGAERR